MSEIRERGDGDAPTLIVPVGERDPAPGGSRRDDMGLAETAVPEDSDVIMSSRTLAPGTTLAGRYEIVRKLGRGGMGEVYLAEHTSIKRRVAVKIAGVTFANEAELMRRFLQEARAASSVHHANIVDITDFGNTDEGVPFFAMEYLEGEDLYETLQREGPLPWPRTRAIMIQILDALAAAHAQGIIHRDMKPHNCFRVRREGNDDFIKVVDFGLAKVLSEHLDEDNMTRSGVVLGTARYMAPEQALSLNIDHRTDIYAAGCIMFELLTGRPPFDANGFMGLLHKHIYEAPPSMRKVAPELGISPDVDYVVHRALAKKPADRYQTAREFADAVRSLDARSGRSAAFRRRRAWRRLAAAAAVLVTLVGGAALVQAVAGQPPDDGPVALAAASVDSPRDDERPETSGDAPTSVDDSLVGVARVSAVATSTGGASSPIARTRDPEGAGASDSADSADAGAAPSATEQAEPVAADSVAADARRDTQPADKQTATKKASKRAAGTKKAAQPKPEPLPETLSDEQVRAALNKAAKSAVTACRSKHGGFPGERVRVSFSIKPDGGTGSITVQRIDAQPLGQCIAAAVDGVTLPKAQRGRSATHTFTL